MLLLFGSIGVLFLAGVLALAVFMRPTADETAGDAPQEQSQPAKKPPLN